MAGVAVVLAALSLIACVGHGVGHAAIISDWPPAPNSGGGSCAVNAQCGIPAANCRSTPDRDNCASLSGTCAAKNHTCTCKTAYYACSNCAGKAQLVRNTSDPSKFFYTSKYEALDGSGKMVDVCSVPRGGAACSSDAQCGARGLCVHGSCVCYDGWLCGNCTMTVTDLLYGLQCSVAADGGGACKTDADCFKGQCLSSPGVPAFCECDPLWGCSHCTQEVPALAKGQAKCP
eukprot:m.47531 g.47531  ORF g.47531 m.47531 type:complete len:232 (-) comp11926_c0_seq1:191-886(-)